MNQLFDYKKEHAQKELRKLIYEEDEDPFNLSTNTITSFEKSEVVPHLEDGITSDNILKEGIKGEKIVHLVNENGKSLLSNDKENNDKNRLSYNTILNGGKVKEKNKEFWEMNTPEMTDEVKRELEILSMRGYWDPKSFFKGSRKSQSLPSEFEFGEVIAGPFESRKNRLTRREKKQSFADELVSDISFKERSDKIVDKERSKRQRRKHNKKH